jgi:hypothetical protein
VQFEKTKGRKAKLAAVPSPNPHKLPFAASQIVDCMVLKASCALKMNLRSFLHEKRAAY